MNLARPPSSLAGKALRFGLVGIANTLVDLAVFVVAIAAGTPVLLANVLAWIVAVTFSYAANSRWSFRRGPAHDDRRSFAAFFSLGALISLGVSSGALLILSDWIGVMPAKLFGVVVAAVLNFLAARWAIEGLGAGKKNDGSGRGV